MNSKDSIGQVGGGHELILDKAKIPDSNMSNEKLSVNINKDSNGYDKEKHAGYAWLLFCVVGMISTLTMYGLVLEYATSGKRHLHEMSFVFVTTSIYTITAYTARWLFGEKHTDISKYQMLILSVTSIASTVTSVRSLRYVIYPVQVLFKSCKPVPVMLFGTILGKRYPFKKYVNVIIITTGVALFMSGGKSSSKGDNGMGANSAFLGGLMLSISLCFDGATGAYEDKLMGNDHVEPFDLMFNIQLGKAVISFITLVAMNELRSFTDTLENGGFALLLLGFTGALGQVFVFVTISKFGALNCALIGLARKMLSLLLSFLLYGHTLNAIQTVGLVLSIVAMVANFYEKSPKKKQNAITKADQQEALDIEKKPLLTDTAISIEEEEEEGGGGGQQEHKESKQTTKRSDSSISKNKVISKLNKVVIGTKPVTSSTDKKPPVPIEIESNMASGNATGSEQTDFSV